MNDEQATNLTSDPAVKADVLRRIESAIACLHQAYRMAEADDGAWYDAVTTAIGDSRQAQCLCMRTVWRGHADYEAISHEVRSLIDHYKELERKLQEHGRT